MTAGQRSRGRGAVPWVVLALVLALAGGALIWAGLRERPPEQTPQPSREYSLTPEEAVASAAAAPTTEVTLALPEEVTPEELGPFVRTEPVPAEPPAGFASHLQVPSIYVDAGVVNHGVTEDNVMTLPSDLSKVGLLDTVQPLSAEQGSTVLAGHVTYHGQRGALYYLGEVPPGSRIQTWDDAGQRQDWVVSGVRLHRQGELPDEIFATDGERRLHLVTCGGEIVETSRGWLYSDNIVVTAVPAA